eukprot:4793904-Pyramimonas_sp.AAC.1
MGCEAQGGLAHRHRPCPLGCNERAAPPGAHRNGGEGAAPLWCTKRWETQAAPLGCNQALSAGSNVENLSQNG